MINSLIIAKEDNSAPQVIGNTLDQLRSYTLFHFAAEESMMEHFDFDGLDEHVAEHQDLLSKVNEFRERFRHEDGLKIEEILNFLAGWLLDHTLGLDQAYGPFLQHHVD